MKTTNELLYEAREIRIELAAKIEYSRVHDNNNNEDILLHAYRQAANLAQTLIALELREQ